MINEMKQYNYIYLITNQVNNKIYVGKHHTDNLDDGYMGSGKLIKKAIQKYSIENFTKEYLAFCDTEEKLNWLEKYYIKKYKATETGYNLSTSGDGVTGLYGTKNPMYGVHRCGEYAPNYGKHHSTETKQKMSESRKGLSWKLTEDTKLKMSQAKKGKTSSRKGVKLSEETKLKMRAAHLGKTFTNEHRQKLSEAHKAIR